MTSDAWVTRLESGWNAWGHLFDGVPEYAMAVTVYLGGSALVLWLWWSIAQRLPRMMGGMSWVVLVAILLTPTVTDGANGQIATAVIGLIFGLIIKDPRLLLSNLLPMLLVIAVGFLIGFLVERMRRQPL
jgi:K+-sensing histidine kinase KdpD